MPDIPKIKKVNEIGDKIFRIADIAEKILQGWDPGKKRMLYLFKDDQNVWSYWDKDAGRMVQVTEWKDKEAWVMGKWIKMSLYYRLHVVFEVPVEYSVYTKGAGSQKQMTYEAMIVIPKSAYDDLEKQMVGRDPNSYYRFSYKQLKKGTGISGVEFVK